MPKIIFQRATATPMRLFLIFFSFTSLLLPFSYAADVNPPESSVSDSVAGSVASSTQSSEKPTDESSDEETSENPPKKNRFVNDLGGIVFLDDFYFFGISASFTYEVADIFIIGLRYGLLFSPVRINIAQNIQVGDDFFTEVYSSGGSLGTYFSVITGYSLINSSLRNFTIFDIELQGEVGYLLVNTRNTGLASDGTTVKNSGIIARPIFAVGLNFIFIERIYLHAGVDLSGILDDGGYRGTGISRSFKKSRVTPFVGLGYRFDARRKKAKKNK